MFRGATFLPVLPGGAITPGPLSRLTPRPPPIRGVGDEILSGGSALMGRLGDFAGIDGAPTYAFGRGGIGGGSSLYPLGEGPRFGEGSRNVLSVIEPELPCRSRPDLFPFPAALPCDEVELCL